MSTFSTFTALGLGINGLANRVRSDLKTTHPPLRISGSTPRLRYNTSFYDFFPLIRKSVPLFVRHRKLFLQIISLY